MRGPDALATHNERMKLIATSFNAIGIGLVGFAVLRPLTDGGTLSWVMGLWTAAGFAFHLLAHYILGRLEKEI